MLTIEVINLRPANKTFFQDQTFQVCKLRKEINKLSRAGFNAEVVLSSPLTRALQTAYGAFYDQVNIYMEEVWVCSSSCHKAWGLGQCSFYVQIIINFSKLPK